MPKIEITLYINNLIKNKLNIGRVSNNSCLQHQMIKHKINYREEQNILSDFTLKIMFYSFIISNQKSQHT